MSDLTELFNRDPLLHSTQDLDTIIEYCRKNRHLFQTQGTGEKKAVKRIDVTKPQSASKEDLLNLDLDI